MSQVTNIKHAREMKALGWPLNCEVIEAGPLPASIEKAFEDGFKAAIKFRDRIVAHVENQNVSTFVAMERAFNRFIKMTTPPDGDDSEARIIAALFKSEFREIRDQWIPIFDDLNEGEGVAVDLRQVWPFKPTDATKRRDHNPSL